MPDAKFIKVDKTSDQWGTLLQRVKRGKMKNWTYEKLLNDGMRKRKCSLEVVVSLKQAVIVSYLARISGQFLCELYAYSEPRVWRPH